MAKKYLIYLIIAIGMILFSSPAYAEEISGSFRDAGIAEKWTLMVYGCDTKVISETDFKNLKAEHPAYYTDSAGDVYSGIPLTYIAGLADDADPETFNNTLAEDGYTFVFRATDWHDRQLSSSGVTDEGYIIADMVNGEQLPAQYGDIKIAPLMLTGSDVTDDMVIGNIMDITLDGSVISGGALDDKIPVTVIKYGTDGRTVVNETTTDCMWLKDNFAVYGDEKTHYKFQGPTFDTGDLWNPGEDKNLEKVDEVVMGTAISDICSLVGGMSPGDELRLTADDGYVVNLMYENIYEPKPRQGTAILAWWSEKQGFAPEFRGAPALFFLADDTVFGNVDMQECMKRSYWRFYSCSGTEYPSAAGMAVRNVNKAEIYPATEKDWTFDLDGFFDVEITRPGFEMGISCGERAKNHKMSYTDDEGHEWTGMPLYLFAGYVDDACSHDENKVDNKAYNLTLAESDAYTVVVEGITGDKAEFSSSEIMWDTGYIIANEVDGHKFDESGDFWPVTLIGEKVGDEREVFGITGISLKYKDKSATGDDSGKKSSSAKESFIPEIAVIAGILGSFLIVKRRRG
ncbi:hypothetical protein [Methanoplanus endosymbiosus]|uniref:Uncharacterized protein n=1 Tax=Methanoplanus endosymbiosus TaxID=33865 RepID=A0A9E7PSV3_9EURY|nr:hypothetical protein [Methanoplanus endosymbiosus]UUX93172.1 hypothetical protein L6E24_03355 [Methanoplanus endosymbiosus]